MDEPLIPEGITGRELDRDVRDELRSLSRETADRVAAHMVAAWALVDVEPFEAFLHAKFAARRGGRIGSVRETYGIVAYRAGEFATAVRELRTAVRITGRSDLLPMIADCERGLGRPERAFEVAASPEAEKLDLNGTIEMMIVVAGAYADIGDVATALATLEIPALRQKVDGTWHVRLWVAYADLLERAGRDEDARRWLTLAADTDTERITDAADRLGRPAPAVEDPTWQDDEQVSVVDAYVDLTEDEDPDDLDAHDEDLGASDAHDEDPGAPDALDDDRDVDPDPVATADAEPLGEDQDDELGAETTAGTGSRGHDEHDEILDPEGPADAESRGEGSADGTSRAADPADQGPTDAAPSVEDPTAGESADERTDAPENEDRA